MDCGHPSHIPPKNTEQSTKRLPKGHETVKRAGNLKLKGYTGKITIYPANTPPFEHAKQVKNTQKAGNRTPLLSAAMS